MATVGVLALQGCVDPHLAMFSKLGVDSVKIRVKEELATVDRLLIPGGESTTMLKLMQTNNLWNAVKEFGQKHPAWGICAGAIIIAKEVAHPSQQSMGLIDIRATRNYYGSQLDSFKTTLEIPILSKSIEVDFIRAPLLEPLNKTVSCLATHNETGVLYRQGLVMASAFHSELGSNPDLHRFFLNLK